MSLKVHWRHTQKSVEFDGSTKTYKVTLTTIENAAGKKVEIDTTAFLKDPRRIVDFVRFIGCEAIESEKPLNFESYNQINAQLLGIETPWADMSRKERIQCGEAKLQWILEHFTFEEGTSKFLEENDGKRFTNKDLGSRGWQGKDVVDGKLKVNGIDYKDYLNKFVFVGGANVKYE